MPWTLESLAESLALPLEASLVRDESWSRSPLNLARDKSRARRQEDVLDLALKSDREQVALLLLPEWARLPLLVPLVSDRHALDRGMEE